ncbi:MAG: DUF1573 domain-containing protein [Marinoscillum sp.]|uniref:DUF1573 domain-containing protein n=1 Tax=Marinoscillum sp. TaxID=2024838 RepID=UPI0033036523
MRKITLTIMLGIAVAAIASVSPLTWKSTTLDLGTVKAGTSQAIAFEFTNESESPVYIQEAKGSCGCTKVEYPREAIAPGSTASITASFQSSKVGMFKKNIKIKTSTSDEYTYLYFSGEVVL